MGSLLAGVQKQDPTEMKRRELPCGTQMTLGTKLKRSERSNDREAIMVVECQYSRWEEKTEQNNGLRVSKDCWGEELF